jgi:hypothetical protein
MCACIARLAALLYLLSSMRALVLAVPLALFVVFAVRDTRYHLRDRKPGLAENLVHLALGGAQAATILAAFRGDLALLSVGAALIVVLGLGDEFLFHHDLPARESDLHAKAHMALFSFVALGALLALFPDADALVRAMQGRASP